MAVECAFGQLVQVFPVLDSLVGEEAAVNATVECSVLLFNYIKVMRGPQPGDVTARDEFYIRDQNK